MADPSVILFEGRWYLFPSCGMLWYSDDFVNWVHHPIEPFAPGYAPTVVQQGEWLYLTATGGRGGSSIWRSHHPFGPWERLGDEAHDEFGGVTCLRDHEDQPVCWGDPMLFVDDDNVMYCYCCLNQPKGIVGVRLQNGDPTRFSAAPEVLIPSEPMSAWERIGEYNQHPFTTHKEGPWMTKRNGRYYLQYSAGGTQFRTYAVGCWVGDSPLGPFVPQRRNPILIHKGGLVNGCAHHSLVEGPGGNLWCFYTTLVGITLGLERRIAMDPAGLDENGDLFVAGPSESPQFAPGVQPDPLASNDAGLLPLTVNQPVTASSWREGREPACAVDSYIRTWWEATAGDDNPWLQVDMECPYLLSSARVMFADRGLDYEAGVFPGPYGYRIESSLDGSQWELLCDQTGNPLERHIAYHAWPSQNARFVRLVVTRIPPGMRLGVWEFTAFGAAQNISG